MFTLFGWTYYQYLFAIGTLRIRPEEVETLMDVKRIWNTSIIRDVDPLWNAVVACLAHSL